SPAADGWRDASGCDGGLPSGRPAPFGGRKRLERIGRLDRVRLPVPFEGPQPPLVRREVDDGKAVLLDRLDLLVHVEMDGRQRAGPASGGRPAAWTRADGAGEHRMDRIGLDVELAAAQHTSDRNRVHIA